MNIVVLSLIMQTVFSATSRNTRRTTATQRNMSTVSTSAPDSDNLYKTNDVDVTPPQNSVDNSQTIGIAIPMAGSTPTMATCTYQDLCARMSGNQPDSQSVSMVSNDRLDSIESLLLSLAPTITAIQLDVSTIKSDSEKVKVMESDLAIMKTQNGELFEQNKELHKKIIELESYSRRNNLVLRNVPEDNVPTNVTIQNILINMHIPNVNSMLIDDAHRIGPHRSNNTGSYQPKPRPIIFRLVMRQDRHIIWEARRNLKGSGFILSEDLAEEHEKDRNRLRPVMNETRLRLMVKSMALMTMIIFLVTLILYIVALLKMIIC